MKQTELFGDVLTDMANGPHLGSQGGLTETLVRRLHENGLTLEALGDPRVMKRSKGWLQKKAREYGLAFDDYTPRSLRPKRVKMKAKHAASIDATIAYYREIAGTNSGHVILVRMGDFYEAFDASAESAAKAIGIVLTKRGKVPMCGFPAHAAEDSLKKLAHAGLRVAIIERPEKKHG